MPDPTIIRAATHEPQYQCCIDLEKKQGLSSLGLMSNYLWHSDPRHLVFLLSRYKFVSKMLTGKRRVLEVGCADAFGTRLVQQEVEQVTAVDFDPVFIRDVQERMEPGWELECHCHDMLSGPAPGGPYDAAYSLDVIEHIQASDEHAFVGNVAGSLTLDGVLILGSPSIHSQAYASKPSKEGHVNCKDAAGLRRLCEQHFRNVFIFSMNDEVVHTGFTPMAHYLIALCVGRR